MSDIITEAMLPEFELSPEVATRHRAWAALGSLADYGLTSAEITELYGFTAEQLEPYRAEWEQLHAPVNG